MSAIDVIGLCITVPLFLLLAGGIIVSVVSDWKQITREKQAKKARDGQATE